MVDPTQQIMTQNKEVFISNVILQPTGSHTRKHHAKRHECGTYCIMCSFMFTLRVINKEKHISCKAKPVAKLFNEHTNINNYQILWLEVPQINKGKARQRNTPGHRPHPTLKPTFRCTYTSNDNHQW